MNKIDYENLAYEIFERQRVGILPTGKIIVYRVAELARDCKITQEELDAAFATLTKRKEAGENEVTTG